MPSKNLIVLCLLTLNVLAVSQEIFWMESAFPVPRLLRASLPSGIPDTMALSQATFPQQLAAGAVSGDLYWTELTYRGARVVSAPRNFSSSGPRADSLSSLRGMAVDEAAGFLYWTSTDLASGSRILRARLNGDSALAVATFPAGGRDAPFGLALDTSSRLYWTNFPAGKIQSAPAQPGGAVTDLVTGLSGPVGIVLDLQTRRMIWTESNAGRIQSADLNGNNIVTLLTGLARPTYLALDAGSGRLYWSESQSSTIQSANLDGSGRATWRTTGALPTGLLVPPSPPVRISIPGPGRGMPDRLTLSGMKFSGGVPTITLGLPWAGEFRVDAIDFRGRPAGILLRSNRPAGWHPISLAAPELAAGFYLLRVMTENASVESCCLIRR